MKYFYFNFFALALLALTGCSSFEDSLGQNSEASNFQYSISSDFDLELSTSDPSVWALMWNEAQGQIDGVLQGNWGEIEIKGIILGNQRRIEFFKMTKPYGPNNIHNLSMVFGVGEISSNIEVTVEAFNAEGRFYNSSFMATPTLAD